MKHLNTIFAALAGAAVMWLAQPTILATQAAAPTPCAPLTSSAGTGALKASATPRPSITPRPSATPRPSITPRPTATPTPGTGDIGTAKGYGDAQITVVNVESGKFYGHQPDAGNIFVFVELVVESTVDKGVSANVLDTELNDADGYVYSPNMFKTRSPTLPAQNDIPAGRKVRGWVTFEVPKTSHGWRLKYGGGLFGYTAVEFDLGR